jgi:hypothetical protein
VSQTYQIEDLGTIDGYTSGAEAINQAGTVTGILTALDDAQPTQGFVWSWFTGMQVLASPGGNTEGRSINNQGQIAGIVVGPAFKAARWDSQGQLTILDNSDLTSSGHAIDENGSVAGGKIFVGPVEIPVMWDSNGARTDLVPVPAKESGVFFEAHGINNSGQVVGEGPFLWSAQDGLKNLGLQGGDARAITDAGTIIAGTVNGAAAWIGGKWFSLDTPGGMTSSALALNNAGHIVGWVAPEFDPPQSQAALWIWDGNPNGVRHYNRTDLTSLVPLVRHEKPVPKGFAPQFEWVQEWVLRSANGINAKGQIVGYGEHLGVKRAYRLSPVVNQSSQSIVALVTQILFGVRLGEGGVVLGPFGPEPQPPVGPDLRMSVMTQDALLGLALYEAAGLLENDGVRREIQRASLDGVAQVVALQIESLRRS